jgi:hypothetical protein
VAEAEMMTSNRRRVFTDGSDEKYSEKTITFETDEGWVTIPSVDAEGNEMSQEQLEQFVRENGAIDPVTGDPLPVFENVEAAERYAQDRTDDLGDEMDAQEFRLGGVSESRKGIRSEAGTEAADKKFQLDEAKADLDGDGELSSYERARGEAIQKAMADDEDKVEAGYGGFMMGDGGCGCDECAGGMMSPDMMLGHVGFDPMSGNPVPAGSNEENVRDDIPAVLSDGEYVVPADVVRYHGLKTFMSLRDEAKLGLMAMQMEGQIQMLEEEYDEEETEPNGEEFEDTEFSDEDYYAEEGEGEFQEEYETPEGNVVEIASTDTVEKKMLPTMKPKVKFAIIS